MTGYGHCDYRAGGIDVSVEVKGYNNRYLDVNVNLPGALGGFEPFIQEAVSAVSTRGRIDLFLRYHDNDETPTITFNPRTVNGVAQGLRKLAEAAGISADVRLEHLVKLDGVVTVERPPADGRLEEAIRSAVGDALERFDESRTKEGEATYRDIEANLEAIEEARKEIAVKAPLIEQQITKNLKERFVELLGESADLSRVYAEIAVQLTKATISEELVRMEAHLKAFRSIMKQRGSMGKKLDFLSQELNREINTIGSKNILTEIGTLVVDVKDRIERIREQLRNVE